MKKALMVASVSSMISQFNIPNIQLLIDLGFEVTVATNFKDTGHISSESSLNLQNNLKINGVKIVDIPFSRNPAKLVNIKAYNILRKVMLDENFDIIHCHTPIGGVLTRLVKMNNKKLNGKIIYTAHGFHFYKGAPKKNWLLYYPVEKIMSRYTDTLITINQEDFEVANTFPVRGSVEYIHGVGVDLEKFQRKNVKRNEILSKFPIDENDFILASVGQLSVRKNHLFVIDAIAKIQDPKVKYLIIGEGELRREIEEKIKYLKLENQVFLLGFKSEVSKYLSVSDLFILPSLQEGLPVSLMEAMCSSLPAIVTNIRGSRDLIVNNEGGYVVEINDVVNLAISIKKIRDNNTLKSEMGQFNYEYIKQFDLSIVNPEMKKIYNKYT